MFGEADADDLVSTWAEGLGRFDAIDIKRGLETMLIAYADYPPTLPQFLGLCRDARAARTQETSKLTVVRYGKVAPGVLAEIHKVANLHADRKRDPKDWARKLIAKEIEGEPVHAYALQCAKEALGIGAMDDD